MIEYLLLVIGLILLTVGADKLVDGASALAKKAGIPKLVIGLTIIAFGTSLPELFVNIFAAVNNQPDVSMGNIIGSCIANILLILGLSAIIVKSVKVHYSTIWKELPFSFLAVVLLFFVSNNFFYHNNTSITRADGLILLALFGGFMFYILDIVIKNRQAGAKEFESEIDIKKEGALAISFMIGFGLLALLAGGELTVRSATAIAENLGLSQFLVSATIIAVGTSLPELFTSIVAVIKKEMDLSVGNIVGSNIFNILFILGITALINPVSIRHDIYADIVFLGLATLCLFLSFFIGKKHELNRWQGVLFVISYVAYVTFIAIRK